MMFILYGCLILSFYSSAWCYFHDTAAASVDNKFCCGTSDYSGTNYLTQCINGKDFPVDPITSCATCVAYQCLDWTVGSVGNAAREASFLAQTGQNVYFGVGSYGSNVNGGGLCYRMTTDSIDRDLILQIINYGEDVPPRNFDLQMAAGGHGIFDACTSAGTKMPQFNGSSTVWGQSHGGVGTREQCSSLPPYPLCGPNIPENLISLCQFSFDKNFRLVNYENPTITRVCQVACPSQLYSATGLRRSDEKNKLFTCNNNLDAPGGFLTKTMDCTKVTYAWPDNINAPTYPGQTAVVPCRRDGYTRVNQMPATISPSRRPTASPSRSPSLSPSKGPTHSPSSSPSSSPTLSTTAAPTKSPTASPSAAPSAVPSGSPTTLTPTYCPTAVPTTSPSRPPSCQPSVSPSIAPLPPTTTPTVTPTMVLSAPPTAVNTTPTYLPNIVSSVPPTATPIVSITEPQELSTVYPTLDPSTLSPTALATLETSLAPSHDPSYFQTTEPSTSKTNASTSDPSDTPIALPSIAPSALATELPSTQSPSKIPSTNPTEVPFTLSSVSPSPGDIPNTVLSEKPSFSPSPPLSTAPSAAPSTIKSERPTSSYVPSNSPSLKSTVIPIRKPTTQPSGSTKTPSLPITSSIPAAFPSPFPSNKITQAPALSSTALQFTQSLNFQLLNGCESLNMDPLSHEALVVTTATSLQVPASFVSYAGCSSSTATNRLYRFNEQADSQLISADMNVLIPLSQVSKLSANTADINQLYSVLQANVVAAVSSGNFSSLLSKTSEKLNAMATAQVIVTGTASTPLAILFPPSASPTKVPTESSQTVNYLAIIVGSVVGFVAALLLVGCAAYLLHRPVKDQPVVHFDDILGKSSDMTGDGKVSLSVISACSSSSNDAGIGI